ncbi:hypothetical protein CF326_g7131 [Tilletia indica]|nr:hypothetical protein CF326_g7131 [Tilletia indica]
MQLDLDFVLPFAAIPENGRQIDGIDDKSELAHRIMLTNVIRLLGAIKTKKAAPGIETRPTLVVLPLSPNHGVFGSDGIYFESKISLETLAQRWSSEGWSTYLSITGAVGPHGVTDIPPTIGLTGLTSRLPTATLLRVTDVIPTGALPTAAASIVAGPTSLVAGATSAVVEVTSAVFTEPPPSSSIFVNRRAPFCISVEAVFSITKSNFPTFYPLLPPTTSITCESRETYGSLFLD